MIFEGTASKFEHIGHLFQVSIRFYSCHLWQQTTENSFSTLRSYFVTKLDDYFWNSVDAKTLFSFLKRYKIAGICQLFLVTLSKAKSHICINGNVKLMVQFFKSHYRLYYDTETVNKCFKLRMARIELDYNLVYSPLRKCTCLLLDVIGAFVHKKR